MKYLKKFETHAEYQTYEQSGDMIKPNVSLCVQENEVHYNPNIIQPTACYWRPLNDGSDRQLLVDQLGRVLVDPTNQDMGFFEFIGYVDLIWYGNEESDISLNDPPQNAWGKINGISLNPDLEHFKIAGQDYTYDHMSEKLSPMPTEYNE